MPYLRNTATYTVETADGERLYVDEFEIADPSGTGIASIGMRKLMLRTGETVTVLADGTLYRPQTGEYLAVIDKS